MFHKIGKALAIAFFSFHFFATALYLAPINPLTNHYRPIVSLYMSPLFEQNWGLFAPEPATSTLEFHVRCQTKNEWLPWMDPLKDILAHHHQYRITHHGRVYYLFIEVVRNFYNDYINERVKKEKIEEQELFSWPSFIALERIAMGSCSSILNPDNQQNTHLQFRVWKKSPPQYSTVAKGGPLTPDVTLIFQSSPRALPRG